MQSNKKVWIVDDDKSIRWVLEKALKSADVDITSFSHPDDVLERINKEEPDVIITDIRMPGMDGISLLDRIKQHSPNIPVIIMTAYSDLDRAVSAFQGGAYEYLSKPFDVDEVISLVRRAIADRQVDNALPLTELETEGNSIIGSAPAMQEIFKAIGRLSNSSFTVLITGESGTGKELVAAALHGNSPRSKSRFIAINTAAIPKDLLESELFGHEKGAFTGATSNRSGYFEVADGGTIFLDEVGELPLSTQVRLLRILESGEYIKVGSSKVDKTNVRIVAATNTNMDDAIRSGRFREDLFYRLSTIIINIPPLRERKEDIPILFRKFASDFAQKYNMPTLRLDEKAEELLCQNEWRGNIRQLRNIAEQMSILEKERLIKSEKLNAYLPAKTSKLPATLDSIKNESGSFSSEREILYKVLFDMKSDLTDLKQLTLELIKNEDSSEVKEKNQGLIEKIYGDPSSKNKDISHEIDSVNIKDPALSIETNEIENSEKFEYAETIEEEETLSLLDKEIEMIKQALIRTKGRRKLASKELGISERTLYRKIKQHKLGDINEL